jgi:ribosomal protein S18 acetylase RimI-like enzyme
MTETISLAGNADIPALNSLINDAYRGEHSRKGWTTEADLLGGSRTDEEMLASMMSGPGSLFLKYTADHEIVGCVFLRKEEEEMYLGMLTVSPELQSKGIGKKLLAAAEAEARKRGCVAIHMTVISIRTELIGWYERHGYGNTGRKKPFHTDTRFGIARQPLEFVVLRKNL